MLPYGQTSSSFARDRAYSHLPDVPVEVPRDSSPVKTDDWGSFVDYLSTINEAGGRYVKQSKRNAFRRAGRVLDNKFLSIADIQKGKRGWDSEAWWESQGIESGIGTEISRRAKEFEDWLESPVKEASANSK